MKLRLILGTLGCLLVLPCPGKVSVAFLGVKSEEEPLLKSELERQIHKEIRTLSAYALRPQKDVDLLYERGILKAPEIGAKRSSVLAKRLDSRILTFGRLGRMEMNHHRSFLRPWRGTVVLRHSLWFKIIDSEDGSVKYSGHLKVKKSLPNQYLGWDPSLGKIDPAIRDREMTLFIGELAKKARDILFASLKGVVEEEVPDKKAYDPEFFEKQRKEREQQEGAKLKSSEKVKEPPKKKPVYNKSLFRPPGALKKEAKPPGDLSDYELREDELEVIEEDSDLMNDVNLMEGM